MHLFQLFLRCQTSKMRERWAAAWPVSTRRCCRKAGFSHPTLGALIPVRTWQPKALPYNRINSCISPSADGASRRRAGGESYPMVSFRSGDRNDRSRCSSTAAHSPEPHGNKHMAHKYKSDSHRDAMGPGTAESHLALPRQDFLGFADRRAVVVKFRICLPSPLYREARRSNPPASPCTACSLRFFSSS
jgi:hypothetical protein